MRVAGFTSSGLYGTIQRSSPQRGLVRMRYEPITLIERLGIMADTLAPEASRFLFSKPVTAEFWTNRRWYPLATQYYADCDVPANRGDEDDIRRDMWDAARKYEKRFSVKFDTLTHFSKALLKELHRTTNLPDSFFGSIRIVSEDDRQIRDLIDNLTDIANPPGQSVELRKKYFRILKEIYSRFPRTPHDVVRLSEDVLCIGVQREGRILADAMGWFVSNQRFTPDMKRVPFRDGLLVGLSEIPEYRRPFAGVVIVDGAIASGATVITLIERLRAKCDSFHVFSVHSGYEGLRAITRYCDSVGVDISITVGHATHGINQKFYAVVAGDDDKVVVGDLGDTISDLFPG